MTNIKGASKWLWLAPLLVCCLGLSAPAAKSVDNPPATSASSPAGWRNLLDQKLSGWELWMGIPHDSVTGLPPGTPTSPNCHSGTSLGLNNDPKHVFDLRMEGGEPLLYISGEIFGGLTTLESFSNYHFQTEFKWGHRIWPPKLKDPKDSGILFHCTGPQGAFWGVWKRCIEFQVEDGGIADSYYLAGTGAEVLVKKGPKWWSYDPAGEPKRFGACKNSAGYRANHLVGNFEKPNGEWNILDLYTIGQTAIFVVNDHVIQVLRHTVLVDGPDHTESPLSSGQIQIQSEGSEAYFRRMRIESIKDFPLEITKATGNE